LKIKASKNVIAPATQIVVSGIVLFVLYRYLYDNLGVAQIGVWSLVLAATSVSRIGDLGLSAGVVKFVAQALGRNDEQRAVDIVQTVVLSLGIFMAVILAIGYPLFSMILGYLIPEQSIQIALDILPYAVTSLWIMIIVGVLTGALDGCMRLDLRSLITALSHVVFLGVTIYLVPEYGLRGVAIAQLIQSVGLLVLLWWALKQQLRQLPIFPNQWKFSVLKDMFHYGLNFQIITVMNMLFDPMVKALLSKFGGLEILGVYEMANGLILKCRAIIIEANRVMVPSIAKLGGGDREKARQMFTTAYNLNFYASIFFYGLSGIFATTICILWLGHYQVTFIYFVLMLNVGWFANTIIGPAYFSNLGSGKLKPIMIAHAIIGMGSFILSMLFGSLYGGFGVVGGAVIGLISGSIFLLLEYFVSAGYRWTRIIIPQGMAGFLIFAVALIVSANGIAGVFIETELIIGLALTCALVLAVALYSHPVRKALMKSE